MRRALAAVAVLAATAALTGCGADSGSVRRGQAQPIRIGTKNFTEQRILGELYRQALQRAGFPVELKTDVGSSEIIHEALRGGAIDMYPEYVGVLLSEVAGLPERPADPAAALRTARRFERRAGFAVLASSPFSDSNAIAVRPELARRHRLRTLADLARVRGATIAAPPEFQTRVEGLVGLRDVYGLGGLRVRALPIGEQYGALDRGRVDAAAVFTTDGRLARHDYELLRDPRRLFADQHVAPIVSQRLLRARGPKLARTIDAVTRRLTVAAMRRMNAAVDLHGRSPAQVAAAFLRGG